MSCGHRLDLNPVFLHRLAAIAWIQPLAWEFPYAIPEALKRPKKKNKSFFVFFLNQLSQSGHIQTISQRDYWEEKKGEGIIGFCISISTEIDEFALKNCHK